MTFCWRVLCCLLPVLGACLPAVGSHAAMEWAPVANAKACTEPGCGYTARDKCNLARHMRTHTGERPFACPHPGCAYGATTATHLKTHMRIHTGERPFACDVAGCSYVAAQSSKIHRHKARVHKE